jgi:hypothetical protein
LHGEKYSAKCALVRLSLPVIRVNDTIEEQADVAQLVEQLIRNQQVVSSSLTVGSRILPEIHRSSAASPEREVIFFCGAFGGRRRIPFPVHLARTTIIPSCV